MMRRRLLILLVALAVPAVSAFGSGSYRTKGGRPPNRLEAEQYNLGKKIFTDKAELPEASGELANEQSEQLKTLQSLLPENADQRADLTALAGRLNAEQLDALAYYLSVRYKVEVPQ